jgi:hypothetical protein
MDSTEILLDALQYYEIPVLSASGNYITVINDYSIEVEANGLYKLLDDGKVVAPFNDLDELCLFILR